MASFTVAEYLTSWIPNLGTLLPGYNPAVPINGAMALYWSFLFPEDTTPYDLDETRLSERQKYMVALRVTLSLSNVINGWLTKKQVEQAGAGPTMVKFADTSKIIKAVFPMLQSDLQQVEAAEGIWFMALPNIPAYLVKIDTAWDTVLAAETTTIEGVTVVERSAFFLEGGE